MVLATASASSVARCYDATTGEQDVTAPPARTKAGLADTPSSCNGTLSNLFNPACWLRVISALIASGFLAVGVFILTIAGMLFNIAIEYGIDKFSVLYGWVKDGVELGWTIFRDLANILIIGLFTFVAISTILGSSEYGYRKMVPRVLLVAILINFSLLFTKLIIDTSHFVASQFLDSMVAEQKKAGTASVTTPSSNSVADDATKNRATFEQRQTAGVAGAFMNRLGIPKLGDSYNAVRKAQEEHSSWVVGIGYGLLALVVSLLTAAVLFYGAYLLVARSVLLLILLLTSSLAFATYLVPKLDGGGYGWKKWWDSLFKSAVFAPLFIILLWISLKIAEPLSREIGGKGSLGQIAMDPVGNIAALFNYLIVLGFLFASIKIASAVSSSIPFMDMAKRATSIAGGIPLAMSGRFAAMLGRNTFGRGGRLAEESMTTRAARLRENGSTWRAGLMELGARTAGSLKTKDFNALQTGIGGRLAKEMGLKQATIAGGKLGGVVGIDKKKADQTADQGAALAKALKYSDEERAAAIKRERETVGSELHVAAKAKEDAATETKKAEQKLDAIKSSREAASAAVGERQKAIDAKQKEKVELERRQNEDVRTAETRHKTAIDEKTAQIEAVRTAIAGATRKSQKDSLEGRRDELIAQLNALKEKDIEGDLKPGHMAALGALDTQINKLTEAHVEEVKNMENTYALTEEGLKAAQEEAAKASAALKKREEVEAKVVADMFTSGWFAESIAHSAPFSMEKGRIAEMARGRQADKASTKRWKDVLKEIQDETGTSPRVEEKKS